MPLLEHLARRLILSLSLSILERGIHALLPITEWTKREHTLICTNDSTGYDFILPYTRTSGRQPVSGLHYLEIPSRRFFEVF